MPNQPATPLMCFRCPPELRALIERICDDRGITYTDYIVETLWRDARRWPGLDGGSR